MTKVRERAKDERGFTLIELLVVILIIGILAAIAIPSFLNQTSKAYDASAKELAHTAQIATESYATDNNGSYVGISPTTLTQYDATIRTAAGSGAWVKSETGTATGYSILIMPAGGNETYTLTRNPNGSTTRSCTPSTGVQGGCINGSW